jgi:hypothetical protein
MMPVPAELLPDKTQKSAQAKRYEALFARKEKEEG